MSDVPATPDEIANDNGPPPWRDELYAQTYGPPESEPKDKDKS